MRIKTRAEIEAMLVAEAAELTALRAHVERLRGALRKEYPCGRVSHDHLCCELPFAHDGKHGSRAGAYISWPEHEGVGWGPLPAALAATPAQSLAERDEEVRRETLEAALTAVRRLTHYDDAEGGCISRTDGKWLDEEDVEDALRALASKGGKPCTPTSPGS
jgi:hypothetical protein